MSTSSLSRLHDALLVDLDGTLTDSAPGIIASIEHAYDALDIPRPSEEALALFVGPPIEESETDAQRESPRAITHTALPTTAAAATATAIAPAGLRSAGDTIPWSE